MLLDFLLEHSFNLRMEFFSDHHETLFGDNDLLDGEDNFDADFLLNPIGEDNFVGKDVVETAFVDLGVEVCVDAGFKVEIQ